LPGVGNGPAKPIGRRRADRKEIGWYGFAAQGGCTRITRWIVPLIGQHYIGRWDPAHSVTPVNSVISRSAVPPPCSITWRSILRRRTGCHTSVSPRGTKGSNPPPSSGESAANPVDDQLGQQTAGTVTQSQDFREALSYVCLRAPWCRSFGAAWFPADQRTLTSRTSSDTAAGAV
jgi:hypothetical protein